MLSLHKKVVMKMVTVKTTGIDKLIREFDRKIDGMDDALTEGTEEAADYLIDKMIDKFGTYQPGWAQLKQNTIDKEYMMGFGGNADKPLVMSSDMMFAFDKETRRRTRMHVVWITNDDPKMPWHMYGVPSAGVPARDPVRPTMKEEHDKVFDIIRQKVRDIFG